MNFIKAPLELFERYHITPSRVLSDGEGTQHFELIDPIWCQFKYEPTCTFWTDEALRAYIEWTEPGGDVIIFKPPIYIERLRGRNRGKTR